MSDESKRTTTTTTKALLSFSTVVTQKIIWLEWLVSCIATDSSPCRFDSDNIAEHGIRARNQKRGIHTPEGVEWASLRQQEQCDARCTQCTTHNAQHTMQATTQFTRQFITNQRTRTSEELDAAAELLELLAAEDSSSESLSSASPNRSTFSSSSSSSSGFFR